MTSVPALRDLEAAAERLRGIVRETPLLSLEHEGVHLFVKPECLQITGSFKYRGANNALLCAMQGRTISHVVTWSSGNHAQAVAAATARHGVAATIVMPSDAPAIKKERTKRFGAEIVEYDRFTESREEIGQRLAADLNAHIIPPYDHLDVICGQSTAGWELIHQLGDTRLDAILIPCGGGGLSSGNASVFHYLSPGTEVFGVEPEDFDDHARSLASGQREENNPDARSVCDALLAPTPGEITWSINRELLAGVFTVSDARVEAAMRWAFSEMKLVLEPGGAASLAAVLAEPERFRDRNVGLILSGGNVDPSYFSRVLAAQGDSEST